MKADELNQNTHSGTLKDFSISHDLWVAAKDIAKSLEGFDLSAASKAELDAVEITFDSQESADLAEHLLCKIFAKSEPKELDKIIDAYLNDLIPEIEISLELLTAAHEKYPRIGHFEKLLLPKPLLEMALESTPNIIKQLKGSIARQIVDEIADDFLILFRMATSSAHYVNGIKNSIRILRELSEGKQIDEANLEKPLILGPFERNDCKIIVDLIWIAFSPFVSFFKEIGKGMPNEYKILLPDSFIEMASLYDHLLTRCGLLSCRLLVFVKFFPENV